MNLEDNWEPNLEIIEYLIHSLKNDAKKYNNSMGKINIYCPGASFSPNQVIEEVQKGSGFGRFFYDMYENDFEKQR